MIGAEVTPALREQMHERALENLAERKATAPTAIDNSLLPAGSPMIYYCRACAWPSDIFPEHYFLATTPRSYCAECQAMMVLGWLPADPAA